jgi:predicted small secreted protein
MLTMTFKLIRKGQALLMGCLLLAACSKNATVGDLNDIQSAHKKQTARIGEDSKSPLPPAPMPVDTLELEETRNPQDL